MLSFTVVPYFFAAVVACCCCCCFHLLLLLLSLPDVAVVAYRIILLLPCKCYSCAIALCVDGNLLSYAVQRVKDNIAYVLNENVGAISKYQQQQPEGKSSSGYYQFCETDRKVVSEPSQTLGMFTSSPDDTTECKYLSEVLQELNIRSCRCVPTF